MAIIASEEPTRAVIAEEIVQEIESQEKEMSRMQKISKSNAILIDTKKLAQMEVVSASKDNNNQIMIKLDIKEPPHAIEREASSKIREECL